MSGARAKKKQQSADADVNRRSDHLVLSCNPCNAPLRSKGAKRRIKNCERGEEASRRTRGRRAVLGAIYLRVNTDVAGSWNATRCCGAAGRSDRGERMARKDGGVGGGGEGFPERQDENEISLFISLFLCFVLVHLKR